MFEFSGLKEITGGKLLAFAKELPVEYLLLDSRKIISASSSLFFAIKGDRHDGHRYLKDLYDQGIRQFIVERTVDPLLFPGANILQVESSVQALQDIAAHHRSRFGFPVIGITGSNGKTIIKEWLSQLLSKDFTIVRSPKSYNSQVGVPLSVWQIDRQHTLGIFEAGISRPGEMERLEKVIQPSIGIFSNIGTAHDEGFTSRKQKISEKLRLFRNAAVLFYCADHAGIGQEVKEQLKGIQTFTWSRKGGSDVVVHEVRKDKGRSVVDLEHRNIRQSFILPFSDDASIENIMHCLCVMLYYKLETPEIQSRLNALQKVAMRLELKEGVNGCFLIDDTYNNDLAGLTIAVNFLEQQQRREAKTVILSDLLESGMEEDRLYKEIAALLSKKGIGKMIGIGETISRHKDLFGPAARFYNSTDDFVKDLKQDSFRDEVILVKGARRFEFEKIVAQLQQKVHGTVLEVNLDALSANLNFYRSRLKPGTRLMVMVKASAYGSGSFEIANLLQFHRVDYLAVAYVDEGGALRENGISLPVMVMNPDRQSFDKLFQYNLEPEIYSFKILQQFVDFLHQHNRSGKIHLKFDTGMRRLGFEEKELDDLVSLIRKDNLVQVASVFTHLAGADEELHNDFSRGQLETFARMASKAEEKLGYKVLKHALNSAGIVRFPDAHMDMVRLGIGLYGIEANGLLQEQIQTVGTLKTIISQIKHVRAGETVGYSRKGRAEKDSRIATIAIGYADGYSRRFSNGVGKVLVNGTLCPVIGNVCMDMTMIDVSGAQAAEGDEVIIFGKELSISALAQSIGTIPYEILTNVGERIKRVFYTE